MASSGSDPGGPGSGRAGPVLVGVTTYTEPARWGVWDEPAVLLPRTYADLVAAAGGTPVLLPALPSSAAAVDRLDAVVLAGGADVAPARYGAGPGPRTDRPRLDRDAAEAGVLRRALERGIPVLGVCRGLQLLNVELGGSLHQHLPDVVGHDRHNPAPGVFGTVEVELTGATAALLGDQVTVRCHHHQGVDRLGDGLVVTGRAADGTVEAVELGPLVRAVQWHPERDLTDLRLVAALVAAARS